MSKPHYGIQDFTPLANGVYFTVIIKKTPSCNGNSPITDPITEMGVAYFFKSGTADKGESYLPNFYQI